MFCLKCGEVISDGSIVCPKCGAVLNEDNVNNEQVVVYASQKEINSEANITSDTNKINNKKYFVWCILAVASFIFLKLQYLSVSIDLLFYGSSEIVEFTGYGLLECLEGSVRTSAIMVILLIIVNIAVLLTGIMAYKGSIKSSIIKKLMIVEAISYLIVTIVTYFDIMVLLSEFDAKDTTTNVGVGCCLNIVVAIVTIILYFALYNKALSESEK
ncbi:MAG: zinc-ribbon domain-containing protein [Lachnospiraceae bacterium]|jgi:hypothetical protein